MLLRISIYIINLLLYISPSQCQDCIVTNGKDAGSACIFPFIFDGEEYNGCILETNSDEVSFEIKSWCSTEVDQFGVHVSGEGKWGHCSSECPIAEIDDYDEDDEYTPCTLLNGDIGSCQPYGVCAGFVLDQTAGFIFDHDGQHVKDECNQGEDSSFVCCPERTTNGVNIDTVRNGFGNADDGLSQVSSLSESTQRNINERLNEVKRRRKNKKDREAAEKDITLRIKFGDTSSTGPKKSSPFHSHRMFNRPRKNALSVHETADEFREVADETKSFDIGVRSLDFNANTIPAVNETCPWTPVPKCTSNFHQSYRTNDGSCNNLKKPNLGRTETPFQRILPSAYSGDGSGSSFSDSLPRIAKSSGSRVIQLPSARLISTRMTKMSANDNSRLGKDFKHTTMVMQMGQFIDHDITHSPIFQFRDKFEDISFEETCCNGTEFPSSYDPKNCYPIRVPEDDPFWRGSITCMEFTRSLTSPNLDCSFGFKEQMNQITHWLDASNIYGSDARETNQLRQRTLGRMKVSLEPGKHHSHPQDLPKCNAFSKSSKPEMCTGCPHCFVAGDERANEQLNLLALHTIWLREHNRVAKVLNRLNPNWNDETLFQEAKRIVVAEYQHIVFKEWLPLVLGKNYMDKFHLWPLSKGFSDVYLDTIDPRVTNEFAAAAFRFGHSLIPHQFQTGTKKSRTSSSKFTKKMTLAEMFFKPEKFSEDKELMNDLTEGLTEQNGEEIDDKFAPDILNHLFESEIGAGGMDLIALNIQRGRDHGLPGYNAYREICQVGKARRWEDFEDIISVENVRKLKENYRHVDDVDLYVGGFLERRHGDSPLNVGPTFKCIIGDTFARLKMGDRFFYDLGTSKIDGFGTQNDPTNFKTKRFTSRQLRNIRKTSMARILCDNSNMDEIQPQAFQMEGASQFNRKRSCRDFRNIPQVDFGGFRDKNPVVNDFG